MYIITRFITILYSYLSKVLNFVLLLLLPKLLPKTDFLDLYLYIIALIGLILGFVNLYGQQIVVPKLYFLKRDTFEIKSYLNSLFNNTIKLTIIISIFSIVVAFLIIDDNEMLIMAILLIISIPLIALNEEVRSSLIYFDEIRLIYKTQLAQAVIFFIIFLILYQKFSFIGIASAYFFSHLIISGYYFKRNLLNINSLNNKKRLNFLKEFFKNPWTKENILLLGHFITISYGLLINSILITSESGNVTSYNYALAFSGIFLLLFFNPIQEMFIRKLSEDYVLSLNKMFISFVRISNYLFVISFTFIINYFLFFDEYIKIIINYFLPVGIFHNFPNFLFWAIMGLIPQIIFATFSRVFPIVGEVKKPVILGSIGFILFIIFSFFYLDNENIVDILFYKFLFDIFYFVPFSFCLFFKLFPFSTFKFVVKSTIISTLIIFANAFIFYFLLNNIFNINNLIIYSFALIIQLLVNGIIIRYYITNNKINTHGDKQILYSK